MKYKVVWRVLGDLGMELGKGGDLCGETSAEYNGMMFTFQMSDLSRGTTDFCSLEISYSSRRFLANLKG